MSKADYIAIGLQRVGATYIKTARATPDYAPPISGEDITMNREVLEADETIGARAPVAQEYGGRIFSGGINFFARAKSSPIFASLAFGDPTSTLVASATTSRDHVFDPLDTGIVPNQGTLWIVRADPSPRIATQLVGAKGGEFNLAVEANGYLGGSLGVSGARLVTDAAEPTLTAAERDPGKKWSFALSDLQIGVNGVALAPIQVTQFSLTYNNNLVEDLFVLGDVEVDDIPVGNITAETTFTPTRNLNDHYKRQFADSPDDLHLSLLAQNPAILEDLATDTHEELEIDIKRAHVQDAPANVNAAETLRSVQVTASPVYDDVTSQLLLVRFRNGETGAKYVAPTS